MTDQLVLQSDQPLARQPQSDSVSLMQFIQRAAADKNFDVAKFQALLEMHERSESRAAEQSFNTAMKLAQEEMIPVVRLKENQSTHSKYADLEAIDNVIRPIYMRHGFCMSFSPASAAQYGGKSEDVAVRCTVLHKDGHAREYGPIIGPPDVNGPKGNPVKTAIQGAVSSTSYLQRVLTRMVWNVRFKDGDKDGNRDASDLITEQQVNQIYDMIAACEMNDKARATFLEIAGVTAVESIPKNNFAVLYNTLRARLKAKEAKG